VDEGTAVVLCADDYGLSEGVSRGILELLESSRVSATSAMTNAPAWGSSAAALRRFAGRAGVGMHLNLTAGAPLGPMPALAPGGALPRLRPLTMRALTGTLPTAEIEDEIARQLDAFEQAVGRRPDFVDGHQHVHALPGIRRALLRVLSSRSPAPEFWIRDPSDRIAAIVERRLAGRKATAVKALCSGFRDAARQAGFATNVGFSGFSPFDPKLPADALFDRAFRNLGPRPVVMAHPGYVDEALRALDEVVATRPDELSYLASDRFAHLVRERRIRLVPRP
jgi:predicted glycoside hydrolase/deacetylase ChbG (UPF0249 family)